MINMTEPEFVQTKNDEYYIVYLLDANTNKRLGNRTGNTPTEATNNAERFADRIMEARKRYAN